MQKKYLPRWLYAGGETLREPLAVVLAEKKVAIGDEDLEVTAKRKRSTSQVPPHQVLRPLGLDEEMEWRSSGIGISSASRALEFGGERL